MPTPDAPAGDAFRCARCGDEVTPLSAPRGVLVCPSCGRKGLRSGALVVYAATIATTVICGGVCGWLLARHFDLEEVLLPIAVGAFACGWTGVFVFARITGLSLGELRRAVDGPPS